MSRSRASLLLAALIASILSKDIDATNDIPVFRLNIHAHLFVPDVIVIPKHKTVKLIIENMDNEAEEVFSYSLNIKKIINGHAQGFIFIGPLESGDYTLQGLFFPRSAIGIIRVSN